MLWCDLLNKTFNYLVSLPIKDICTIAASCHLLIRRQLLTCAVVLDVGMGKGGIWLEQKCHSHRREALAYN